LLVRIAGQSRLSQSQRFTDQQRSKSSTAAAQMFKEWTHLPFRTSIGISVVEPATPVCGDLQGLA
jgi:hypothetical protein